MVWQGKEELWFDNIGAEGQVFLTLGQGEGDSVAQLIMNQVEESQMIERDWMSFLLLNFVYSKSTLR